jgi:hypothetical protein
MVMDFLEITVLIREGGRGMVMAILDGVGKKIKGVKLAGGERNGFGINVWCREGRESDKIALIQEPV